MRLRDRMAGAMAASTCSYTSAISSCTRVPSMFGAAMGVWERMRAAECPPNAYAYSAVLTACERAGAWEEALLLMGDMKRDQVRPNRHVFASAIGACASQGRWSDALRLLARMRVEGIAADEASSWRRSTRARAAASGGRRSTSSRRWNAAPTRRRRRW